MRRRSGARWVSAVRYMYNHFSKWHVEHAVMKQAHRFKCLRCVPVQMLDGRVLYLDLRNPASMPYLMQGEFPCELTESEFVKSVVQPGDTAVDIGANVGWYSSLLSELVGPQGKVYAFEPNRKLARLLEALAETIPQLHVEQAGVADHDGEATFNITENWVSGTFGKAEDAVEEQATAIRRLDSFLEAENPPDVTFIKCDAEGAEIMVLKGAEEIINSERPPIWMIEMSCEEAARFNCHPREITDYFSGQGLKYSRLMLNQTTGRLEPLDVPISGTFWFNAVFVPERLEYRLT